MSIELCEKCRRVIDTDETPDCYEVEDEDCKEIKLEYALCETCKANFVGLIELKKRVDAFTSDIFDWVSLLGEQQFLFKCYDFQGVIEKFIDPKRQKKEGA